MAAKSTIFKSNKSQAVRLPKAVAFPEDVRQVEIIKVGNARLITPVSRQETILSNFSNVSIGFPNTFATRRSLWPGCNL